MDLFGRRRDYSAVAASLPVSRCGCPESRTRPRLPQARINTATETPSAGPAAAAGRNRDSGRSALHRHRLRRPRPAAGAAVTVTSEFLGRRLTCQLQVTTGDLEVFPVTGSRGATAAAAGHQPASAPRLSTRKGLRDYLSPSPIVRVPWPPAPAQRAKLLTTAGRRPASAAALVPALASK